MNASVLSLPAAPGTSELSIPELEDELLGLAGHLAAAQCRFLLLLAEYDRRRGWADPGLRSCAHWLSWRAGMSLRTATEQLRVAHALTQLPKVTEVFAEGRISYSKVRAITRIAGVPPSADDDGPAPLAGDAEQVLLDLALTGTASHVETVVRATRRSQNAASRATAQRALSWHHDADGMLVLRGRIPPDEGALLVAAIDALVAPRAPVAHPVAAPLEGWEDAGREQAPGAVPDRIAARRADALLTLVGGTGADTGADVTVARGRAHLIVHVEAATGTARIEGGPEIPAATAERLACDAQAQVLLHDRAGNRLYLGRTRRLASPAQIAALAVRDGGGCRFPGCSNTRHLHAHHVRPWQVGGRTDLDNLVLICGFHHRLVHDLGYRIRSDHDRWAFERPDGGAVPEVCAPLVGNTESLLEVHAHAELGITPDSLTPYWEGERLDPTPILDRLLPRPRPVAA